MLESLYIRNLALVSELHIFPSPHFNTVTGETGAGKSLIIGALKLLAGWRTSPSVIRKGEKSCEATGIFVLPEGHLNTEISSMLEEAGVPPCEENRLMIKRVITESGSRAYVNGSAVTAVWLKSLGDKLIDIHGPHDNQSLLSNQVQLKLLDEYASLHLLLAECADICRQLTQKEHELAQSNQMQLSPEETVLLRHQVKEIKLAALSPDEEEPLIEQYRLAGHARTLRELALKCASGLDRSEQSITGQIGDCVRLGREINEIDPQHGQNFVEQLDLAYESLRDIADDLENYANNLDIDEERLQELENRLELIQKLKRKYGRTIPEILATMERIQTRLETASGQEERIETLETDIAALKKRHKKVCNELHEKRLAVSSGLADTITEKLQHLGFANARFGIELTESKPGPSGIDSVEFMFAPNIGEDMHPLNRIASSGEIARVMLAIKTVLSAVDDIPVLVFDEIDANIGGRVSVIVAQELQTVAAHHQVFSITHLPAIAAAGERHFLVGKHVENERTFAEITPLETSGRIDELVRMLGADATSESAREHAKELLNLN